MRMVARILCGLITGIVGGILFTEDTPRTRVSLTITILCVVAMLALFEVGIRKSFDK